MEAREEQLYQLKLNYSARRSGSVVTRIFTAVSLWWIRVSKPLSIRSSTAILPVMKGLS